MKTSKPRFHKRRQFDSAAWIKVLTVIASLATLFCQQIKYFLCLGVFTLNPVEKAVGSKINRGDPPSIDFLHFCFEPPLCSQTSPKLQDHVSIILVSILSYRVSRRWIFPTQDIFNNVQVQNTTFSMRICNKITTWWSSVISLETKDKNEVRVAMSGEKLLKQPNLVHF